MEACSTDRRRCLLVKPVRDGEGRVRFGEAPEILREIQNVGRRMFLVRFLDGGTTFLFPEEVTFPEGNE